MSTMITQSDRPTTGRHRAPGRNWAGLASTTGRHSQARERRAARWAQLAALEVELHDSIHTARLPRVVAG